MALFLGHSRRVHEHHYRMQMGHYGLVEVFKRLASMQKQSFAEVSTLSMANSPDNNSNYAIIISSCDVDFHNSNEVSVDKPTNDVSLVTKNHCFDFEGISLLSCTRNNISNDSAEKNCCDASGRIASKNNSINSSSRDIVLLLYLPSANHY